MATGTEVTVREAGEGVFMNRVEIGGHVLAADEPAAVGGDGTGPNPYEYLLAALGACTSMTLRMYARRKEWPLEHVGVRLRHGKIHAQDCADCETDKGRVDNIDVDLELTGDLDDAQRERLLEIAHRCPVHRTLKQEKQIRVQLA